MKYNVSVETETRETSIYVIDVNAVYESGIDELQKEAKKENQADLYDQELTEKLQIAVDSSRLEYEHSFRRAERLDNKVYILLTVCGFIFALLTGEINKISEIDIGSIQYTVIAVYDIVLLLSIIGTVLLLLILIYSLSGKDFKRYDTNKLLEKNLISTVSRKTLARYTIIKYEVARDYNNRIVSKQFKWVNRAVKLLILIVVLLMLLTILGNVVPTQNYLNKQVEVETAHQERED